MMIKNNKFSDDYNFPTCEKNIFLPSYRMMYKRKQNILAIFLFIFLFSGCGGSHVYTPASKTIALKQRLDRVRFTIQVGAFENLDNAVRFTEYLQNRGLDAYHFVDSSGLYKVRFGNYPTKKSARQTATRLQSDGIIDDFYIVRPKRRMSEKLLRGDIVRTARSFIGVPYKWGGSSPREGFDCSGLTMTVYHLNGLNLPRTSRQQWKTGFPVSRGQLVEGDLVFFSTSKARRISHVGIYTGKGKFIHAPGRGQTIRSASLATRYYKKRYVGARRYL
jgi:hypothetical protein